MDEGREIEPRDFRIRNAESFQLRLNRDRQSKLVANLLDARLLLNRPTLI